VYGQALVQVLSAADTQQHYGVELSLVLLADKAPQLVQELLASPRHLLDQLEAALISAQAGSSRPASPCTAPCPAVAVLCQTSASRTAADVQSYVACMSL
jgi:hypothetical protein